MAITSTTGLVDALRQHHVLSPAHLDEVAGPLQARCADARTLARELLQRGWLTAYQVNQLVQGRGGDLVLGPYILLERLGEGGMGTVFKARHQLMNRTVALKLIRKEHLAHADAVQRFHREIQLAAQMDHPHLVRAHDASQVGDTHFLVMEYAEGTDLQRLIRKSGPLSVGQACAYIQQAALGLQHASERGLVHRDIKPSNLQVTAHGTTVKILDMGLARSQVGDADNGIMPELTQNRTVMGTPDYMAPEQIVDPRKVDVRADIYSLGCTFYFLLAGRPPFADGAWEEKLVCHRKVEPQPIEQLRPDVPPPVGAILRKMMAKRPEDRNATAAALAEALVPFGQVSVSMSAADTAALKLRLEAPTISVAQAPAALLSEPTLLAPSQDLSAPEAGIPISDFQAQPSWASGKRPLLILAGGGAAALALLILVVILLWPKGADTNKNAATIASGNNDGKGQDQAPVELTDKANPGWHLQKAEVGAKVLSDKTYVFSRLPQEIVGGWFVQRDSGDWDQWLAYLGLKAKQDVTVYVIVRTKIMGNDEVTEVQLKRLAREGWQEVAGDIQGTFNPGEGWEWKAIKKDYKRGALVIHWDNVNPRKGPLLFVFKSNSPGGPAVPAATNDPKNEAKRPVHLTDKAAQSSALHKLAIGEKVLSDRTYLFSRLPEEMAGAWFIQRDTGDHCQWLPAQAVKADRDVTAYLILRSACMGKEDFGEFEVNQLVQQGWKEVVGDVQGTFNSGEAWAWKAFKKDYRAGDLTIEVDNVDLKGPVIFAFK